MSLRRAATTRTADRGRGRSPSGGCSRESAPPRPRGWGICPLPAALIVSASFRRIPVNTSDLTTGGLIALVAVPGTSLIGAILGGLAGMHFHRKVDRAAFEPYPG